MTKYELSDNSTTGSQVTLTSYMVGETLTNQDGHLQVPQNNLNCSDEKCEYQKYVHSIHFID